MVDEEEEWMETKKGEKSSCHIVQSITNDRRHDSYISKIGNVSEKLEPSA